MANSLTRVLEVIQSSPSRLTAKDIQQMQVITPSYVGKALTILYQSGRIKRVKMPRYGRKGNNSYAYYATEKTAPATTHSPEEVKVVVGSYTLTVSEARALYAQLKTLFDN